jgi:2-polyprenyl-6-methoxyphenol hydroxylase-like FAD-dependent oxidoreductase
MNGNHAIVIGASIGGLVAARVLSERFDRVTVYDRDGLPASSENRSGVPQGRHAHGLLASGFAGLKELFPALERTLLDRGAIPGDVVGDLRWFQHGCYKARFPSEFQGVLLSRALLEGTVREQVRQLKNVTVVDKTHISGLVTDDDVRRVTGIRIRRNDESLVAMADFVVDASGRSSRAGEWLGELGYRKPPVDSVDIDLAYTTRTFRRRPGDLDGDLAAIISPTPPHARIGVILPMEGDRWIVSMGGWVGDHAPTEPNAYLAFARSLARPDIYNVIRDAEPLTDAVTYAVPSNLRRRYERLRRFPGGYLVMGDAICSFNPIYGQGMSVATLEGLALRDCLDRAPSLDDVWRPFFTAAARIIDTPWAIAAGTDFAFPGVKGRKPAGTDFINWYMGHVHRAASTDREVCRAFFNVANLLEPASTLFRPGVVARVVRGWLSSRSQKVTPRLDAGAPSRTSA